MPWMTMDVREQRVRFVVAALRGEQSLSSLCREFGISRPTGRLWLERYRSGGVEAIAERSRRPQHSPQQTAAGLEQRFERATPNKLWQMDFKGPKSWHQTVGPLSILDDHSRYVIATEDRHPELSPSQRNAVNEIFLSREKIIGLDEIAGAGKTPTLAVVREGAEAQGYTVEGFAPTSRAACRFTRRSRCTDIHQRPRKAPASIGP